MINKENQYRCVTKILNSTSYTINNKTITALSALYYIAEKTRRFDAERVFNRVLKIVNKYTLDDMMGLLRTYLAI